MLNKESMSPYQNKQINYKQEGNAIFYNRKPTNK